MMQALVEPYVNLAMLFFKRAVAVIVVSYQPAILRAYTLTNFSIYDKKDALIQQLYSKNHNLQRQTRNVFE